MFTEQQVMETAYFIWEQEGRPDGRDVEIYFLARQMLEEQEAASPSANTPLSPVSSLQPPSPPKPVERFTGKGHSKKA